MVSLFSWSLPTSGVRSLLTIAVVVAVACAVWDAVCISNSSSSSSSDPCAAHSLPNMTDTATIDSLCGSGNLGSDVSCQENHGSPTPALSPPRSEPGVWSGQYIRNPLARAVYFKLKEDERNKDDKHIYWYRVIVSRFPEKLQSKFVQLDQDSGTSEFLESCQEKSDHVFTQLFHSLARPILNIFMTQTSINGLLNRGSMFVFSKAQFEKLVGFSPYHKGESLLDLGAGDGKVTKQMSSYFHTTYTTEMSGMMVRRLTAQGFQVLGVNEWQSTGVKYDLISCLNLLDRCNTPLSLLADIKAALKPGIGRLLVAVVIPFKPYVEFESKTHEPTEFIHVKGSNFEEQVDHFESIFRQSGFEVETFSRLPYLCEGDLRHSFYVLTDAIFVLRVAQDKSSSI